MFLYKKKQEWEFLRKNDGSKASQSKSEMMTEADGVSLLRLNLSQFVPWSLKDLASFLYAIRKIPHCFRVGYSYSVYDKY